MMGPVQTADPVLFEVIDETRVLKAAQRTKGGLVWMLTDGESL